MVTGGNPIAALPEPERMRAALRSLDALVVVDVLESEVTELATHVLPATGELERTDISMYSHLSVHSAVQTTRAVVAPVAARRPVWWMLGSLAARLDLDLLGGVAADDLTDESYLRGIVEHSPLDADALFDAGSRGVDLPVEYGWVHETMLPDGHWRLAPSILLERLRAHREPAPGLLLAPRREMAWSNSVRYGAHGEETVVKLHPSDAAAAGLADGDPVTVTSEHGALTVTVAVDEKVRAGVVSLVHGRRGRSPGSLLSSTAEVDPLTTMPHASGVVVTVAPAGARGARR